MKRSRYEAIILTSITLIVIIITHIYVSLFTPHDLKAIPKVVFVPQGASFRWIALKLEDEGIIRDSGAFSFLARMKGAVNRVKAGEYELNTSMRPTEILDRLLKGISKEYVVSIPEGYNMFQIASLMDKDGLVDKVEFLRLAQDKEFVKGLGIDGDSVEGYLFPDTYRFNKLMGAEEIIERMVVRFNEVYSVYIEEKARSRGMARRSVVILASIIEKEAGIEEEKPLISAVFHNRLKRGMLLQSDPTVIYGLPSFNGDLTRKDMLTPTPYNTYIIRGLPPGPISNPGRSSLLAAVAPADVRYLYFVSRNDGSHEFSRTLREHRRAVNRYQRR